MAEKSIKKNAIFNVIKTMMGIIFPLITFPYVSRILSPNGIGKVNFANSIVSYFAIFASLGISSYGIREAAKIRQKKVALTKFVKEILVINLTATIISYCFLFVALIYIPSLQAYKTLLIISGTSIILTTIGIDWLYGALEEFQYIAIRSIFFQFLSLCLLLLFVKSEDDYTKYAVIIIISSGGSNIWNFIHSRKYINFKLHVNLEFKKHLKPIIILFATSLAASIFTSLDTSMLGFMTNTTEVGYYSASVKIVRMIRDLFPAIFGVLFARVSSYVGADETDKLKVLSEKTLSFIFCFTLPIICGLILLAKPIVLLICGEEYFASITTTRILVPLILVSACSGFLGGQILISYRKDKIYLLSMIIAAVTNIILNYLFIPLMGATGAALGTLCAEFAIVIVDVISLRWFIRKLKILKHIFQCIFATIIMGVIVYFAYRMFEGFLILQCCVPILIGMIVYGVSLILMKNDFVQYVLGNIVLRKRGDTGDA